MALDGGSGDGDDVCEICAFELDHWFWSVSCAFFGSKYYFSWLHPPFSTHQAPSRQSLLSYQ